MRLFSHQTVTLIPLMVLPLAKPFKLHKYLVKMNNKQQTTNNKQQTTNNKQQKKKMTEYLNNCSAPLLKNPDLSANYSNCYGACCLPCPTIDAFYPEGLYVRFFTVLEVFSMISFFSILFVLISYAVLPERRRFPQVQEKEKKTKIKIKIK